MRPPKSRHSEPRNTHIASFSLERPVLVAWPPAGPVSAWGAVSIGAAAVAWAARSRRAGGARGGGPPGGSGRGGGRRVARPRRRGLVGALLVAGGVGDAHARPSWPAA